MELFAIYLISRLTEFKASLSTISQVSATLLLACLAARLFAECGTSAAVKQQAAKDPEPSEDTFQYLGVRRVSQRGVKLFGPIFVLSFMLNMFIPTTRDAVAIAGGYGLVEAVKNETVQRLFGKSTKVASQWLDEQLNGTPKNDSSAESKNSTAAPEQSKTAR